MSSPGSGSNSRRKHQISPTPFPACKTFKNDGSQADWINSMLTKHHEEMSRFDRVLATKNDSFSMADSQDSNDIVLETQEEIFKTQLKLQTSSQICIDSQQSSELVIDLQECVLETQLDSQSMNRSPSASTERVLEIQLDSQTIESVGQSGDTIICDTLPPDQPATQTTPGTPDTPTACRCQNAPQGSKPITKAATKPLPKQAVPSSPAKLPTNKKRGLVVDVVPPTKRIATRRHPLTEKVPNLGIQEPVVVTRSRNGTGRLLTPKKPFEYMETDLKKKKSSKH
jgi:hypothetical protein